MKIAVLSGSPHANGTTARLADSFILGAQESGCEVVRFNTAFLNVHPCVACEKCHSGENATCAFQDDMTSIGNALSEADAIAFVTPIYYYGICAQLKTVIDRFYAWEGRIRKNQKTVFITAMADDVQERIQAANASYQAFVNWLKWENVGILNAFECTVPGDLAKTDYEKQAYELGKNLGK